MSDLTEVQPIDEYVQNLLKKAKEKHNSDINLENPTRGQRLEAAVAMSEEERGIVSAEIMLGRRISRDDDPDDEDNYVFIEVQAYRWSIDPRIDRKTREDKTRQFYNKFAHEYCPKK